jgi:hypothetical protein
VFPSADDIPEDGDSAEASKDHGCVVHGSRSDRNSRWHTEQDDRERNPADGHDVLREKRVSSSAAVETVGCMTHDGITKLAKRKRRILNHLPFSENAAQDWEHV